MTARVDGIEVAAGNAKLMKRLGIQWIDCHHAGTIIHMAVGGEYAGHIVISDIEKPHAKEAVRALKAAGIEKTVMLTGDSEKVAEHVAKDLDIDEVHAELLPADKVSKVEELLNQKPGQRQAGVRRGRYQRRARSLPCGYRHRDGAMAQMRR